MKTSTVWILALTVLLTASVASTDVVCVIGDQEALGNSATGYVPSVWTQSSADDLQGGAINGTDTLLVPASVVLNGRDQDPGVYVLVGGTSRSFYRYNISSQTWAVVESIPVRLGDGSAMAFDGSRYVYTLIGGSSTAMYRYDVITDSWSFFADAPGSIGNGGDITWDGTSLYILRGATGREIWSFDPAAGTWTVMAMAPRAIGTGASIVVLDGDLYITRGSSTTTFWRYAISAGTWTTLAASRGNIGAGADMVIGPGDMLYCSYGSTSRNLERYDPGTNAWTVLPTQPYVTVKEGGGLAYDGSATIYSTSGNARKYFMTYSTSGSTWDRMIDVPVTVTTGGCMLYVPSVRIEYDASGTYLSSTFDTGTASTHIVGAFWNGTVPPTATVTIEVRVSDTLSGGMPTGPWQNSGSGLGELTGRYVQWRATLTTTDSTTTPVLQEVRVYYYRA